ncbi:MAG: type II toxin-antitoxin system VapC family toxin [Planctomycetota bacterium]
MTTLVDTNILLRLADPSDANNATAAAAVATLRKAGDALTITPQVLYEYWVAATRTVAHNGLGQTADEAAKNIDWFASDFTLLKDQDALFAEWFKLVKGHDVTGVNAYDTRVVAAMRLHDVSRILTFNEKDFRRYEGITVLEPETVAADAK